MTVGTRSTRTSLMGRPQGRRGGLPNASPPCFGRQCAKEQDPMSTNDTYLAVFLGSKTSPRMQAWMALPEAERRAKEKEGMAAWKAWVEKHHAAVSAMGGPLGK